ncbi:hypothetical protein J6590_067818 [Homalodisca vitripennis]|nr:hypothetical protein J6590_067818 [Homalodisca vitripennis]
MEEDDNVIDDNFSSDEDDEQIGVCVLEDLLPPKEAPLLITLMRNSMHRLSKLTKRKGNGKSVTRRCHVCYQEGKLIVSKPSALQAHTTRGPAPGADDEQTRYGHDVTRSSQRSFRDILDP